jgi:hypothetical protein
MLQCAFIAYCPNSSGPNPELNTAEEVLLWTLERKHDMHMLGRYTYADKIDRSRQTMPMKRYSPKQMKRETGALWLRWGFFYF